MNNNFIYILVGAGMSINNILSKAESATNRIRKKTRNGRVDM